jgi:hypothetical protein
MGTERLRKRIEKIEQRVDLHHDGLYTLEELCRMMWDQGGRQTLRGMVGFSSFVTQFDREDAERALPTGDAAIGGEGDEGIFRVEARLIPQVDQTDSFDPREPPPGDLPPRGWKSKIRRPIVLAIDIDITQLGNW